MDREVCRLWWVLWTRTLALWVAAVWAGALGLSPLAVLGGEAPAPSLPGNPPWVILQIARRDLIPLDGFQIIAGKSAIGVTSGGQVQRLFADRRTCARRRHYLSDPSVRRSAPRLPPAAL